MEIHRSARKHGVSDSTIEHAVSRTVIVDLEPDGDPPRVLATGPDSAGNLLEIIWIELDAQREVVIHAMGLRPTFHDPLSDWEIGE
jgi:hypothetical protein